LKTGSRKCAVHNSTLAPFDVVVGMMMQVWPRYVISARMGRLGNQMYIYAALLGIAAMNNMTPVYYSGGYTQLEDTLKSLVAIDNTRIARPANATKQQLNEISNWMYDNRFELVHRSPATELHITGYWQSWKYFSHIEPVVRRQFTFKDSYVQVGTNFLQKAAIEKG
jgi:hypothetical protein